MANGSRGPYWYPHYSPRLRPLVEEFRTLMRAAAAQESVPLDVLVGRVNDHLPSGAVTNLGLLLRCDYLSETGAKKMKAPMPEVSDAIRLSLPAPFAAATAEVLDLIRDKRQETLLDFDPDTREDRGQVISDLARAPGPVVTLVGPSGGGRHHVARTAAERYTKGFGLGDPIVIDCHGRSIGPGLTAEVALARVVGLLGGHATSSNAAAKLPAVLLSHPALVVLDAVDPAQVERLHQLLSLPDTRSRVWITSTDGPSDAIRMYPLDSVAATALLVESIARATAARGLELPEALTSRQGVGLMVEACDHNPLVLKVIAHVVADAVKLPQDDVTGFWAALMSVRLTLLKHLQDGHSHVESLLRMTVDVAVSGDQSDTFVGVDLRQGILTALAHAPDGTMYADVLLAACELPPGALGAVDAELILRRLAALGLMEEVVGRPAQARPAWRLPSPLLRSAAENLSSTSAGRPPAALYEVFLSHVRSRSGASTLPVGPWPFIPSPDRQTAAIGWFDRHVLEVMDAARTALGCGLLDQGLRLVELGAGYFERAGMIAELDWLTGLACDALEQVVDLIEVGGTSVLDAALAARIELLRAHVQHRFARDFSQQDGGSRYHTGRSRWWAAQVQDMAERQVLEAWAQVQELRDVYSEPGPTVRAHHDLTEGWLEQRALASRVQGTPAGDRAAGRLFSAIGRMLRLMGLQVDGAAYGSAEAAFTKALVLAEAGADVESMGHCYKNIGRIQRMRGALPEALVSESRALAAFLEIRHVQGTGVAHGEIARILRHLGRLSDALQHLSLGLSHLHDETHAAGPDPLNPDTVDQAGRSSTIDARCENHLPVAETASLLLVRARIHTGMRRLDDAAQDLETSIRLWQRSGDIVGLCAALHNRAILRATPGHGIEDVKGAEEDVRAALAGLRRVSGVREMIYARADQAEIRWIRGTHSGPIDAGLRRKAIGQLRQVLAEHADQLRHLAHAEATVRIRLARYLASLQPEEVPAFFPGQASPGVSWRGEIDAHLSSVAAINSRMASRFVEGYLLLVEAMRVMLDLPDDGRDSPLEVRAYDLLKASREVFRAISDLQGGGLVDAAESRLLGRSRT